METLNVPQNTKTFEKIIPLNIKCYFAIKIPLRTPRKYVA
jgi:hypothetical protein